MLLQEEDAVTLGLSTGQALAKLRDQLSSLLEQHQRVACVQASVQVYIHADTDQKVGEKKKEFLYASCQDMESKARNINIIDFLKQKKHEGPYYMFPPKWGRRPLRKWCPSFHPTQKGGSKLQTLTWIQALVPIGANRLPKSPCRPLKFGPMHNALIAHY